VSQVFEDSVIQTRINLVLTGTSASRKTGEPPLLFAKTPCEKFIHCPEMGLFMASSEPSQYCTLNFVA